ncbi:MAG TPA: trypsin-like serine protease, partial [Labilithrix sp.]|nr:trypsin-like serine protease [Labilithrix sp.]
MRFRLLGASLALALSFGLIAGCSQSSPRRDTEDPPQVGSKAQAIQGGTNDGAAHPYVVGVCIGNRPNCGICTGTLILPNLVVTARHCVQQTNEQINCATDTFGAAEPVNFVTTFDEIFQTTKNWHAVKAINVPQPDGVCGNDIALITLQDPIPATEATPIVPGVQYSMGDIDRYSHTFTAIGYGKISPADPPPSANCFQANADYTKCPGKRRIRPNISVACIPGDEYIPCPTDADTLAALKDSEFLAGDGTCQGDSGSGAFETKSFGKGLPVTFGVLSRGGTSKDGTTCVSPIYTRLDKWRDLVVQVAGTASNNWTLYPKPVPDWTVFVPPAADAGKPEAGPRKPTNQPDGTACSDGSECASKVCVDT